LLLGALAGALTLAGCGGGSDKEASTAPVATTATPATTATTPAAPTQTATTPPPTPTETTPAKPPSTATPDQPDQGGGTEPARTELEFRGTKSGVKPRSAGVAPFISVKVTLTSEDGSAHVLKVGSHSARVGGNRTSAFFTLPGLPSGKSYKGTVDGKPLTIRSTSEPGP
jgi:hypothetical protein